MARCKDRHAPKVQPFDLQAAGKKQAQGRAPTPDLDKPQHVIIDRGFWRDLPWEQRTYYVQDAYIAWPGANTSTIILQQPIGSEQVLVITSFLFRAILDAGQDPWQVDPVFARDTYLMNYARFFLERSGTVPYDRNFVSLTAFAGIGIFPGTAILNQEQAVPGIPFAFIAHPGETVQARIQIAPTLPPAPWVAPSDVGAELRGIWIPKSLFDRYNTEMER